METRFLVLLSLALIWGGESLAESSVELAPYEVDDYTLHLWHLDEDGPPFRDEGPFQVSLEGLFNGAKVAQGAHLGLEHSVSFDNNIGGTPGESDQEGAILTLAPVISSGKDDRAPESLHHRGEDGAFTYEALVKLNIPPSEAKVIALAIISMDGEEDERIFNFRIERQGFLAFAPLSDSGAKGGAIATLPRTGPHAFNTSDWFHVAVSYDGEEDSVDNLRLYWTRVDSGAQEANLIGSGSLSSDFANDRRGDFAIGNEARAAGLNNAEAEPFLGCLDEVRISSVARHPTDFLFVRKELRFSPKAAEAEELSMGAEDSVKLGLVDVLVNGEEMKLSSAEAPLVLPPGLHRLDFDLSFFQERAVRPVKLRTQLGGMDESWRNAPLGMNFLFEVLDAKGKVMTQARSGAIGSSFGWVNRPEESTFTERSEPLFLPHDARALRLTLDSGSSDTTGTFVIDDLAILLPGKEAKAVDLNGEFSVGENLDSAAGVPAGWQRGRENPAIAQLLSTSRGRSLAVIDGDRENSGSWSTEVSLDPELHVGRTVAIRWKELYNVTPGSMHRASYVNVPAGSYTFRAVWLSDLGDVSSGGVELPIRIRFHLKDRAWFWPLVVSIIFALVALLVIREVSRINRRKLRQLWIQNTLERDRTRIARDMHDDLGTRVSVLNINASLAKGELHGDPAKVKRYLDKLEHSARELVIAMKDLVWVVDPSHDTLEHLASHLTGLVEELLGDGPIRCRLEIPANFPEYALGSDFRQNVSLAVKEALNNILKHAGPCEVLLTMECVDAQLVIEVCDTGCGFTVEEPSASHHGLRNFASRLKALGGTCHISSSPGKGTCIRFNCPLHQEVLSSIP